MNLRPALRILTITFIIALLQPAPILTAPGPAQTVTTNIPILGVHTRLTDEVEPWKIKHSLELVRELGSPWIVEFFPWAYYQGEDGSIAWDHPDLVVEHATAQGLTVIGRIGLTPHWARPKDSPLTYLDESAYDDFAAFAAAFAARYNGGEHGKVDYIIVGNEPNLSYEWGYRETTAADYVALLEVVYTAVKTANPDMQILAGSLAPTIEPDGSPWGLNDLTYLDRMYQAGAADYFDGLAVHTYGLTFPPEADPGPDLLNFRRVELVRQIMLDHDDANSHIFITEAGWNDHPRWTRAVRPGQRIDYTLRAIDYAEENWPYVEVLALWAFRFPAPTKSYMDYFTLVTPEFVNKPIYGAIRRWRGDGRVD